MALPTCAKRRSVAQAVSKSDHIWRGFFALLGLPKNSGRTTPEGSLTRAYHQTQRSLSPYAVELSGQVPRDDVLYLTRFEGDIPFPVAEASSCIYGTDPFV